jgi:hypothetical protein
MPLPTWRAFKMAFEARQGKGGLYPYCLRRYHADTANALGIPVFGLLTARGLYSLVYDLADAATDSHPSALDEPAEYAAGASALVAEILRSLSIEV